MKKVYFVAPKGNLRHQTLAKTSWDCHRWRLFVLHSAQFNFRSGLHATYS